MRRRRLGIFAVIGATLAALAVGGFGVLSASAQGGQDNVDICHRTDAANNPYSTIQVDPSSIDGDNANEPGGQGDHFLEHTGPLASSEEVAQQLKNDGIEWGDIIPPLEGVHEGLNWPEGQAIFENNCNFVTPPTTAPPPTAAAPTTAPPPPPGPAAAPPPPPGPAVRVPSAPAPVAAAPRVTG
jgi:hypothetical protein